jgi:hypothetical protein
MCEWNQLFDKYQISSAQETPEPITETPTTNNHENRTSMDKMEDNTNKLKAKRTDQLTYS